MGSFDAFFQKWLVYYENVSDCKPLILSGGPMLIHAQPNYVLRCSKLFKFSFGMGLLMESGGGIYSKLPNVKKMNISFFHMRTQFSYIWWFWVHSATRLHWETHTKWKFEQFATSEYQFCWRTVENERSRPDWRFAIGDIFIVNQWFLKKIHQKPKLRTHFSRKN